MSITWGTLKASVARRLNDSSHRRYSAALLLDGVNEALTQFAAAHTGMASTVDFAGDGATYEYALPTNLIDAEGSGIYAVHWQNNEWLRRLELFPGIEWPSTSQSTTSMPLGYILWPSGNIRFTRTPGSTQTVTAYYVAYYPAITDDDDLVRVPTWAREAISYYTMAYALESVSLKTGNLAQYKTKAESGTPEHNPLLRLAEYFKAQYWTVLGQYPMPQYAKLMPEEHNYHV